VASWLINEQAVETVVKELSPLLQLVDKVPVLTIIGAGINI
jgi:hypothetical protein